MIRMNLNGLDLSFIGAVFYLFYTGYISITMCAGFIFYALCKIFSKDKE